MTEKSLAERMKLPWHKMPVGGTILEPGSSVEYRTGDWRIRSKPVIDQDKCIKCLTCWILCPDASIRRNEDSLDIDEYHCKGCGICVSECPVKAIEMREE